MNPEQSDLGSYCLQYGVSLTFGIHVSKQGRSGPCSSIGSESDSRSRGGEFNPGQVPY